MLRVRRRSGPSRSSKNTAPLRSAATGRMMFSSRLTQPDGPAARSRCLQPFDVPGVSRPSPHHSPDARDNCAARSSRPMRAIATPAPCVPPALTQRPRCIEVQAAPDVEPKISRTSPTANRYAVRLHTIRARADRSARRSRSADLGDRHLPADPYAIANRVDVHAHIRIRFRRRGSWCGRSPSVYAPSASPASCHH